MKAKYTLSLILLCIITAPLALFAQSRKNVVRKVAAKPVVEYCVFKEDGYDGYIQYPDGTRTEFAPLSSERVNPSFELTKLARSGWRVVAGSNTNMNRYWTLERRR